LPDDLLNLAMERCFQRFVHMPKPKEITDQVDAERAERTARVNDELRERQYRAQLPSEYTPSPEEIAEVTKMMAEWRHGLAERKASFAFPGDLE